jgi:hypothetical protein
MIALTFNRRTELSHIVPNGCVYEQLRTLTIKLLEEQLEKLENKVVDS